MEFHPYTDKGLISSSSSSSNLPTPRPYPKLLPEVLRKKIEDYHRVVWYRDDPVPYCCYSHLIEPDDVIDPDDPRSLVHLENPSRWLKRKIHLFSPNQRPFVSGKEIAGTPLFELYSIQIKKVDPQREFSSISIKGNNTGYYHLVIYNLPEESEVEEIPPPPLNQPLPLKNIFRPPSALKDLTISLSNPSSGGWRFWYAPPCLNLYPEDMEYGSHTATATDELTDSEAIITYELINSAAIAELEFTFLTEKYRSVTILSGSITVTTNRVPFTERIIRQFSSPQVLQTNKPVPVNRSVFGVPIGKTLHIDIDLDLKVDHVGLENRTIRETIEFSAPDETKSEEKQIILSKRERIRIGVKVSWWNIMV